MITKITGKLIELQENTATLGVGAFEYEVFVSNFTHRHLQLNVGNEIKLFTIEFIDGNPQKGGRMTPRLVGFDTIIEKQFFELFCSVPGLGVKKALRAMVRPGSRHRQRDRTAGRQNIDHVTGHWPGDGRENCRSVAPQDGQVCVAGPT